MNKEIELRPLKKIEQTNLTFDLQDLQKQYPEFELVTKGKYYPYNHIHNDENWGCAWRSIQLMLSSRNKFVDFDQIFYKFSRKKELISVLQKRLPNLNKPEILQHKWAPQENQKNWAEPFIGQLIAESFDYKTSLFLVNGLPASYAPQEVFEEVIEFAQFKQKIQKIIPESPLMIDDSILCLSIVGYHVEPDQKFSIIFADPHIKSNKVFKNTGIYQIIFDSEGKQVEVVMSEDQKKSMTTSYEKIFFYNKKWMVMHYAQQ